MQDHLIITPVPSLVATLLNRENAKGSALTKEEVESIRTNAPCIVMTPEQRAVVDVRRGYDDIDPEHAWEEWQIARIELSASETKEDDANQVVDSTATRVTPPASSLRSGQESRHVQP